MRMSHSDFIIILNLIFYFIIILRSRKIEKCCFFHSIYDSDESVVSRVLVNVAVYLRPDNVKYLNN